MSLAIFKHLLPRAKAWTITKTTKTLRKFFEGLVSPLITDTRTFFDLIWYDLFPETTRELTQWEAVFGLKNGDLTTSERIARLDGLWKATGGQDPQYIQDTLQTSGFDVYVHEWWEPSFLTDRLMEESTTASWTAINGAVLAKISATTNPDDVFAGDRSMSCVHGGVTDNPGFYEATATAGITCIVSGYVKSDGVAVPQVVGAGGLGTIWTGVNTTTDWQAFNEQVTLTGNVEYSCLTTTTGAGCIWDQLSIQQVPPVVRNPFEAIGTELYGCGDPIMECGEPLAECGSRKADNGYMLVNKIYTAEPDYSCLCGEAIMECGEPLAEAGQHNGFIFARVEYEIPANPDLWPYILYIGGETWGDAVDIPANRIEEFEDLILKICPAHLWICLMVRYINAVVEPGTGYIVLEPGTGDTVISEV